MVLTRSSTGGAPPATTRATARKRRTTPAPESEVRTEEAKPAPIKAAVKAPAKAKAGKPKGFLHTPRRTTLVWLAASLPAVAWDTAYVLLRPHSMPGGAWHEPFFTPYALYGAIDRVYDRGAWDAGSGFTGAQSAMNVVETLLYLVYLGLCRSTNPQTSATALLVLFAAATMTLSKTLLYWLNEAFSGFTGIGHNDTQTLLTLWALPNGLWLLFPAIIIWTAGREIVHALAAKK